LDREGGCELLVRLRTREARPVVIAERRVTKRHSFGTISLAMTLNATGRRLLAERGKLSAREVIKDEAGRSKGFNLTLKR
jgi:hypothetical protein